MNNFPNCLFLKLHCDLKKKSLFNLKSRIKEYDVALSLRFGEETFNVLGGTVSFGLRGGTLKLKLKNAKMPMETIKLVAPLKLIFEREIQTEQVSEPKVSFSFSLPKIFGFVAESKSTQKQNIKFKDETYLLHDGGTDEEPIWNFQVVANQSILKGGIRKEELGTLQATATRFEIEGVFSVKDEDVRLTRATGVWAQNIGTNKKALLERYLFLRYIIPKLQPYLSKEELIL